MNDLPMNPLPPEQQRKVVEQMYLLMDKQVKSYHKHRHMGNNTSVSVELAQELMESVEYTISQAGGLYAFPSVEEAFLLGQQILSGKLDQAKDLLALICGTAPNWQTECRWEAFRYLHHYLEQYDWQHLAHQGPEGLFYPILIAPPENTRGIDSCLFYLHILWIENQIMAALSEDALEAFWDSLPSATLNPCEPLLLNCMAKSLLEAGLQNLLLEPEEHFRIQLLLTHATEEDLRDGANRLCQWLGLADVGAKNYVHGILPQLCCRMDAGCHWDALFL